VSAAYIPMDDSEVRRALVVSAHPDDVDFGAAGTVAKWTAAGIDVSYVFVTNGDAGGFDDATPREKMPLIRQAEQRRAAEICGVSDVTFLGYPDGRVHVGLDLRMDLAREIRRVRPQRVLCHSPERNFDHIAVSHPDHLAAGEATLCAVYPDARNPYAFPELREQGLEDWKVPEVWLTGSPQPNHHVDVTESFPTKIAALRAHVSQTSHLRELEGWVRSWLGEHAQAAGMPRGRLAEAYRVLPTL